MPKEKKCSCHQLNQGQITIRQSPDRDKVAVHAGISEPTFVALNSCAPSVPPVFNLLTSSRHAVLCSAYNKICKN